MLLRSSVLTVTLSLAAVVAQGQGGCVINTDKPAEIYGARSRYGKLIDVQGKDADKKLHFTQSVQKLVEDDDKIDNQIGRYYMLGKFYAAWLSMGDAGRLAEPAVMLKRANSTRAATGFTLNKVGPHDLFAALDTAFTKVEQIGGAGCADSTGPFRNRVYSVIYNEARKILAEHRYDSTVVLAKIVLVIDPKALAPWNLIAQAYQEKGDEPAYRSALLKLLAISTTDTNVTGLKQRAHYNLAVMSLRDARTRDGDTRKALANDAADHFKEFLKLRPNDPTATSGLVGAMMLLGDTATARQLNENMLKNPAQFSALALFEAAGNAYNSAEYATALKFYEAGVTKNPYYRDGLFSMTSTLLKLDMPDRAIETMRKVFALDPNNRENFQQMISAMQSAEKLSANKGTRTDSIIFYYSQKDSTPAYTKVTKFEVEKDTVTLGGVVQNLTTAPRSQQIDFEFLSATGSVVGTATVNVTDIPPKTGKVYAIETKAVGAVGWRYKPWKQ